MQTISSSVEYSKPFTSNEASAPSNSPNSQFQNYQIIRRNGSVVPFEPAKIAIAMMKAFLAVHGTRAQPLPAFAKPSMN